MKTDDDGDVDFQNNDIEVINAGLLSCCFRFRAMTSMRTHITWDTIMSVKDSWVQLLYPHCLWLHPPAQALSAYIAYIHIVGVHLEAA